MKKQCTSCEEIKELDEFHVCRSSPQGRKAACKSCRSKREREAHDPVKARARHLWNVYKITEKDYERMFEEQGGCCAICGTPDPNHGHSTTKRMCIDHDHVTGDVRGLLCNPCNRMLGDARDKLEVLRAGADYLEKFV